MSDYKSRYVHWLKNAKDSAVLQSLLAMQNDEAAQEDAFYKDIEFGTAGLRGIMAAGTNRLNVYTVFRTTTGVVRYMEAHGMHSCAITYDTRNNSRLFCQVAAATLASHGMKVYFTSECMPTPFLSFMVRNYHTDIGINVTASHNASQYNGYKVYDCEGCQLTDEAAAEVTEFIKNVDPFEQSLPVFEDYVDDLIVFSSAETEQKYIETVLAESLNNADGVKVVYTPLNGAGYRVVPEVLRRAGLDLLKVVPSQALPNGNFPTCPYPNPEKSETLALAVKLAEEWGADAVVANDPDSDRLGTAVKTSDGFRLLSGNDVGVLLADYILSERKAAGTLPQKPVLVKTIVSTLMIDELAKNFGAEVVDVLTGFKYIGNAVKKLENNGEANRYVFGFEESCGYLKGTYVRDKDGVVAAMLFCQCVSFYKKQGKTLVDRLDELKKIYGNFVQKTFSYTFAGVEGDKNKTELFRQIRLHPLQFVGKSRVMRVTDFLTQTQLDVPKANVLRYNSQDGSQLILRPSGTEPIVKCYISVTGADIETQRKINEIKAQLDELIH